MGKLRNHLECKFHMTLQIVLTMTTFMNFEKVKEAEKILRETDSCCFCDFICPPPSKQENDDRESSFGILQSLWDHIEQSHTEAFEWLG